MSDYTPYDAYTMRKCIERQDAAIASLRAEVERLRELLYRQIEIDYTSEDAWKRISKYLNDDNCKGFLDSSRKSLIALRTRLEQAEAELAAEKGKVEKVRKWLNGSIINSCPECGQEIGIIDWNALEQILRGEP